MLEIRDSGKEEFRKKGNMKGGIQEKRHAGKEVFSKGGMQDRKSTRWA